VGWANRFDSYTPHQNLRVTNFPYCDRMNALVRSCAVYQRVDKTARYKQPLVKGWHLYARVCLSLLGVAK